MVRLESERKLKLMAVMTRKSPLHIWPWGARGPDSWPTQTRPDIGRQTQTPVNVGCMR